MHDIRSIRDNPSGFDEALARRGIAPASADILAIDSERRTFLASLQELEARRNALAKQIGEAKRARADSASLEAEGGRLRDQIAALKASADNVDERLEAALSQLPNLLAQAVPPGADEADNSEVKRHGAIRNFAFAPRQHFEIGEALGLMDFANAGKIAGSRFTILRGALARLERALAQFMIDLHTDKHGYSETAVPLLVNDETMYGTGQLPKFAAELFRTTDGRWLIPTAEVPLTNMVRDEILPLSSLPLRMASLTPCFRSEAGAAGRDTRGMLRQHQFAKVEMVSIVHPDLSDDEHERMTRCAETVLEALELPYRRMLLCAGDTGFSAMKTYDLEVWLPGQGAYREISSCSNCGDFQARRMAARFRKDDGKSIDFVHTLNGSGVAVGRALIAVLENHQQEDGSVMIPSRLRPYMGGLTHIAR
ncbi:MAG: serine--tRNA ligase [Rhodospirillales bacterium 20-60-12]|nr:MAG: serine--tRNA ligase [Rhodospirillales bacterium 20-60-12]HQT67148.1 serine--tRNA ligase [Acetobacteraceae bacterium]